MTNFPKSEQRLVDVGSGDLAVHLLGDGPPILFVHGFPLDHSMWSAQCAALATDYRLIVPDLRGFGGSSPASGCVTMGEAADELNELLNVLQVESPVTYCGLSMGGYIGFEMWHRHRDRLASMILCDTRAAADSETVAKGRQLMAAKFDELPVEQRTAELDELAEGMLQKLFAATTFTNRPEAIASTRQVMCGCEPATIAAYQRGMASRTDFRRHLSQLDLPLLLVCGEHDVITPTTEMQQVAEGVPGARYLEIESAGHMAPLEQPEVANKAILEFLRDAIPSS
jgi:pimeloyl-ACP methyl ester carboxylesterase